MTFIKSHLKDYIWTNQEFYLLPSSNDINSKSYFCLEGSVYIGENIDDEWFIVFLFYEISKKFTNTAVCCIH